MNGMNSKKTLMCTVLLGAFFTLVCACAQARKIQTDVPALRDVFAGDFAIGCILSYKHIGFPSDPKVPGQSAVAAPAGGDLVKFTMSSMSPGNNMKPMYTVDVAASAAACAAASGAARDFAETHPVVRFNGDIIAQLNWAKRNGFTFRGHVLVWHNQTPTELFRTGYRADGDYVSRDVMAKRLDGYIGEVVRLLHAGWPGLLSAMDVVNEVVTDEGGAVRTTGNEWYAVFRDDSYVANAFEIARKYTVQFGETQMKLYYNDYNTSSPVKADGIVRLCGPIFRAGYLDGIGMQEHDTLTSPSAEEWIKSYDKFFPICSEMAVTELDVSTLSGTNTPSAGVLVTQANQYAALFKCFIERSRGSGRGKIVSVTKDGLNDEFTFVTNQSSSLWDADYRCKPAFFAVVETAEKYRELADLIAQTEKTDQGSYPAAKKASIASALKSAKDALARNYSFTKSAPEGLGAAIDLVKSAVRP
jgi:endo-1,4-beta-xylanase